ncbi:MAG: hypothetical protein KDA05_08260 [Phycisphaerales bacterium]|nr:hypothetical protein [Phycisphaerales bacterium]
MRTHRLSLAFVLMAAIPWSSLLLVAGLWVLIEMQFDIGRWPRWVAGLTAILAGMLVFMCLVADRVFPRASRAVVGSVEAAVSAGVIFGLLWLLVLAANLVSLGA